MCFAEDSLLLPSSLLLSWLFYFHFLDAFQDFSHYSCKTVFCSCKNLLVLCKKLVCYEMVVPTTVYFMWDMEYNVSMHNLKVQNIVS